MSAVSPSDRLRGQHLLVSELVWKPFGFRDPTTGEWTGFDFAILDHVANTLGFTYDVVELVPADGETWTEAAIRGASNTDLVMSYWLHDPARRLKYTISNPVLS